MSLYRLLLVTEVAVRYLCRRTQRWLMLSTPVWLAILGITASAAATAITCAIQEGVHQRVEANFSKLMGSHNTQEAGVQTIYQNLWTSAQIHDFNALGVRSGRLTLVGSAPIFNGMVVSKDVWNGKAPPDSVTLHGSAISLLSGSSLAMESGFAALPHLGASESAKLYADPASPGRVWVPQDWLTVGNARIGEPLVFWAGRLAVSPVGIVPRVKSLVVAGAMPPALDAMLAHYQAVTPVVADDKALSAALILQREAGTIGAWQEHRWLQGFSLYTGGEEGKKKLPARQDILAMMAAVGIPSDVALSSIADNSISQADWLASVGVTRDTVRRQLGIERVVANIILTVLLAAAAANCMGVLQLLVQGRRRDIAVLRSLGLTAYGVATIFAIMALTIGAVGLLLGNATGLLVAHHLNGILRYISPYIGFDTSLLPLPVAVPWARLALVTATGMIACVLLGLLPARHAATILPTRVFAEED